MPIAARANARCVSWRAGARRRASRRARAPRCPTCRRWSVCPCRAASDRSRGCLAMRPRWPCWRRRAGSSIVRQCPCRLPQSSRRRRPRPGAGPPLPAARAGAGAARPSRRVRDREAAAAHQSPERRDPGGWPPCGGRQRVRSACARRLATRARAGGRLSGLGHDDRGSRGGHAFVGPHYVAYARRVRRLGILLLLCCARPVAALAQDSTSVVLQQARDLYESLELERAVPLLRQILSPGWTSAITTRQRVDANLYLGAALSLLGNQDSARAHFRTALERDPFSDLDPARFTPAQIQVFQEARRTVFAVAVRPLVPLTLDPQSGRMTFAIVATHDAAVRCDLRSGGAGTAAVTLFAGDLQGGTLREIDWNGLLAGGQLAPAGRYAFVVLGESRLPAGEPGGRRDSAVAFFDVQQDEAALEDTLAELSARELLPERYPSSAATGDEIGRASCRE